MAAETIQRLLNGDSSGLVSRALGLLENELNGAAIRVTQTKSPRTIAVLASPRKSLLFLERVVGRAARGTLPKQLLRHGVRDGAVVIPLSLAEELSTDYTRGIFGVLDPERLALALAQPKGNLVNRLLAENYTKQLADTGSVLINGDVYQAEAVRGINRVTALSNTIRVPALGASLKEAISARRGSVVACVETALSKGAERSNLSEAAQSNRLVANELENGFRGAGFFKVAGAWMFEGWAGEVRLNSSPSGGVSSLEFHDPRGAVTTLQNSGGEYAVSEASGDKRRFTSFFKALGDSLIRSGVPYHGAAIAIAEEVYGSSGKVVPKALRAALAEQEKSSFKGKSRKKEYKHASMSEEGYRRWIKNPKKSLKRKDKDAEDAK